MPPAPLLSELGTSMSMMARTDRGRLLLNSLCPAGRRFYPTEAMSGREESCSESLASTLTILRSSWDSFSCIRASLKRADSSATSAQTIRGETVNLSPCSLAGRVPKKHDFEAINLQRSAEGQRGRAAYRICSRSGRTRKPVAVPSRQSALHPTSALRS